jgi:hypothetical protein
VSGFFRPEAMALVMRWREALIAVGVGALGLWIAVRPGPIVSGFGYALVAFGAILLFLALRRIRFARKGAGEGPGVVTLDEGRIAYLGPYYGGTLAVQDLTRLALRRGDDGGVFWVLAYPDGVLVIPANAVGADVLFDAFTTLPGLNMEFLLRTLNATSPGTVTLWSTQDRPALT